MQQVTHRKMSFNYRFKNHQHNSLILQEKLRESEWKRSRLEIEFNELVQQSRANQETDLMGHKRRYRDLLESEKYRIRRNEQLFATLKRLDMRISFLSATTEKYKTLRSKYQVFSNRIQRGIVHTRPTEAITTRYPQNEAINNSDLNRNLTDRDYEKTFWDSQRTHKNQSRFVQTEPSPKSIYHENPKYYEHPESSEEIPQLHKTLFEPKSYVNGNDGFGRDEIEYLDNIRHQTANNSNGMSLAIPKYDSVDRPTTDINKYAIGNSIPQDFITGAPGNKETIIPRAHDLSMPEEILKKYQRTNGNDIFVSSIPVDHNIGDFGGDEVPIERKKYEKIKHEDIPLLEETNFVSKTKENVIEDAKLKQDMGIVEEKYLEVEENTPMVRQTKESLQTEHQASPIPIEANKETIVGSTNEIEPRPLNLNEQKTVEALQVLENETEITEPKTSPEMSIEPKVDDVKGSYVPPINTAEERIIEDLEVVTNIDSDTFGSAVILSGDKIEGRTEETEPNNEHEESLKATPDLPEENIIQPENEYVETIGNDRLDEKLSQLNLDENDDELDNSPEDHGVNAPTEEAEHGENSGPAKDQEVVEVCQGETSDKNISNSNQNSQQDTTDKIQSPREQHENSEDSEMRKFKKQNCNNQQEQYQYYDNQNIQNYPADQQGQQYDVNGHPINYDPGTASTAQYDDKGQPYAQGYEAVYNEKGELVMPGYDQNGQQYDQQYYQNDPNYANYDQYAQQYDDQQQYAEYDQEGYDPAQQQANYDGSAQQGYEPNAQYDAYYAEVKYDQDAFYRGDTTQETVQSPPQHEENEGADKTNLVHMLESDTENSSRQENKATTESDFDFSNN